MRLGIVNKETWTFFEEIYAQLRNRYDTAVFERHRVRIPVLNKTVSVTSLNHDLYGFMRHHDIVFFEWASSLLATAAKMPKTCKIVTRLHRYELYDWAEKINWQNVDAIILVSRAKQREFVSRFPAHRAKTHVTGPSISIEKFVPRPRVFQGDIGTLCYIDPRKRVYELILDFYELAKEMDYLRLHIGGAPHRWQTDDYYTAVLRLLKKLQMENKVVLYGHVEEPAEWYNKIDIFVSNSYSEGLQVAPMEAMASGCYCLSHWWDGAEELLPKQNLFYTGRELREKVVAYCQLSNSEKARKRSEMQNMARERFDIRKTISDVCGIIEALDGTYNGA
jgi:glycosyltransferase involved in cell wall biosynthesis